MNVMMVRLARILFGIIAITGVIIDKTSASKTQHGNLTNRTTINADSKTVITHGNVQEEVHKTKGKVISRKSRSPQYGGLGFRTGLAPLGLPYAGRYGPALGLQPAAGFQTMGQLRGYIPQDNRLLANTGGYRLPYNLQLARLLSTLNLLQARSAIGVSPASRLAEINYKPQRLKYDSIPLKPEMLSQGLGTSELPLLLGANAYGAGQLGGVDGADDDDDDGDSDGFCSTNPCHNGGKCKNLLYGFRCECKQGYTGKRCKTHNPCAPNPCEHDGECSVAGKSYDCSCSLGWKGEKCEVEDRCQPNPCMNGGSCTELTDGYDCTCMHGFRGKNCQDRRGSCSPNPCLNDGHCIEKPSGFECVCRPGYSGMVCAASQGKCQKNPCMNGGKCVETLSGTGYECSCPSGYRGEVCDEPSPCQANTCQNGGTCFETDTSFRCMCKSGFSGRSCEVRHSCQADTCRNGARCIEHENGFKCVCAPGYRGLYCDDMDRCHPNPCDNDGECVETTSGYRCHCQARYKGTHCQELDMCVPSPCKNGGQCLSFQGGFKCLCQSGYSGDTCEDKELCDPNPCRNGGSCSHETGARRCSCRTGFTGDHCELIDNCLSNPCQNGATCNSVAGGFTCTCTPEYRGTFCHEKKACNPNPCDNGGKCLSTSSGFVCRCPKGFTGETCSDEDQCEPNPCENGARCINRYGAKGGFACECLEGFRGTTCRDKDPCHPDPCANGGVCTEIGGGFTCNCTLGFKGSTCSEVNACLPNPCQHEGVCREVVGGQGFVCQCRQGYKGLRCGAKDRCHPNPCMHDGDCMEINDELGFLCNCTSGFRGTHCQDKDPCKPNPCANSGLCIHTSDGGFVCNCTIGFKGHDCKARDLCKPNPCQYGDKCIQEGTESYQCVKKMCEPNPCQHGRCIEVNDDDYQCACDAGYTGKNCETHDRCHDNPCMNGGTCTLTTDASGYKCACENKYKGANCTEMNADSRQKVPTTKPTEVKKDFCSPNPCKNNGVCVSRGVGYHCKCKRDFKGPHCEMVKKHKPKPPPESVVDLCTPSPCKNRGVCVQEGLGYTCACKPGFSGFHCQVDMCDMNPCKNGRCVADEKAGYKCVCHSGFVGKNCDENYCVPNPCLNGGICKSVADKGYQCKCREGYNGPHCERSPCAPNPCLNGGTCVVFYTVHLCKCPAHYRGNRCEASLLGRPSDTLMEEAVRKATQPDRPALQVHPPSHPVKDSGEYTYSSAPKFFPGPGEECKHCDRSAHCVGGHCICKEGFVGDGLDCWAERQEDRDWACDVNPCKNGGTCKPGIGNCVCRLGYIGQYCEEFIPPSIHLSFDKMKMGTVLDESGDDNNAVIANGAEIASHSGHCGNAANLQGGDILLDGAHFADIPRKGITIATWIKLDTILGVQSIFDTVGSHSKHRDGQYHLEVDDGKVRWFHRNENHQTIFSVLTPPVLTEGKWTQVTVTYSSDYSRARVFVDGDMVAEGRGHGFLSQDWAGKAGIGKHEHIFGSRLLRGMVDEFFIFPGELPRLEILVLMRHCKVYFTKSHKKTQQAVARGPPGIFSPYSPGIQNYIHPMVQPAYVPNPVYSPGMAPPVRQYQQPSKSSDTIASNLEKILDSFEEGEPSSRHQVSVSQEPQMPGTSYGTYQYRDKPRPGRPYPSTNMAYGFGPKQSPRPMHQPPVGYLPRPIGGPQPSQMQGRLAYSLTPYDKPPGGVFAPGQMKDALRFRNGGLVSASQSPVSNFAAMRKPPYSPLQARQSQYSYYKNPPGLQQAARDVQNTWFKSVPPRPIPVTQQRGQLHVLSRAPLRSMTSRPGIAMASRRFGPIRPQYQAYRQFVSAPYRRLPSLSWKQREMQGLGRNQVSYGMTGKIPLYNGQPSTLRTPSDDGHFNAIRMPQNNEQANRRLNAVWIPPHSGPAFNEQPSPQTTLHDDISSQQNAPQPPLPTGPEQNSDGSRDAGGKYVENLQGILDKLQVHKPGVSKMIDPSKYLAFRLKPAPVKSRDPFDLYEPAVHQLNSALQKLMGQRQVQFQPEQLKFIIELLEKAIRQLEPSNTLAQPKGTAVQSDKRNSIRFIVPHMNTMTARNGFTEQTRNINPTLTDSTRNNIHKPSYTINTNTGFTRNIITSPTGFRGNYGNSFYTGQTRQTGLTRNVIYRNPYQPITYDYRTIGEQRQRVRFLAKRLSKILKRKRKSVSRKRRKRRVTKRNESHAR
ncbi:neurogenic locus notch homolog protein 2 isoform X2 [Nematostella vectensis]|uniref:neurogenic locus notch homolog protein 2 isoform X2 n=1 Tax=Nematostella vectensis TaxID=45351 RepID=UPI0020770562|nr:neurogenic locus notch homolog protein 2 isoform X2 [Nematostella vectensis]